jgi:replication factor C subunit 2/4
MSVPNKKFRTIPWIEKYRPANLSEMMIDANILNHLKIILEGRTNIHVIITGPPGIGKTSSVICTARKSLGKNFRDGFLKLNAADDRGARIMRETIPPFCKKVVNFSENKIILFDEADNMTEKCQNNINEFIKTYGETTKFIFTCNNSEKIIEDIQSVCRIIIFRKLLLPHMKSCIEKICSDEDIEYDEEGINILFSISEGDMRKCINNLQRVSFMYDRVTKKNVLAICKIPDPERIADIIKCCYEKKIAESVELVERIIDEGYYCFDIVSAIDKNITDSNFDDEIKIKIKKVISETKVIMSIGIRSKLQFASAICKIIEIFEKYK